jgi:hypothetical protein
MMDKLLSQIGIHRASLVLGVCSNVIKAFEQEFAKDQNAKGAAVDAPVQILLSYKESISIGAVPPPGNPPAA